MASSGLHCSTFVLQCSHMRSTAMPKNAYVHARVDKLVKARAEKVLSQVGISTSDLINILLH